MLYHLLLLIHILIFVYWLGADLAVYYASSYAIDSKLSKETRLIVTKIMNWCDLVPRICMSLTLTSGVLLSSQVGVQYEAWQLVSVLLLGFFWLGMVLTIHYLHDSSFHPQLVKFDFIFRWILIISILVYASTSYMNSLGNFPIWLNLKLVGFAFTIFCGLMIRIKVKGFNASYVKLMAGTNTSEGEKIMSNSLSAVKPWVWAIWITLIGLSFIGISKPLF